MLLKIEHHHFVHFEDGTADLKPQLEKIMASIEQLTAKVDAMTAAVDKVKAESTAAKALIAELKTMLAEQTVTPEFEAKLGELADRITAVDDVFEDVTPVE